MEAFPRQPPDQCRSAEAPHPDVEKIWTINAEQAYLLPQFIPNRSVAASPELQGSPAADGVYRFTGAARNAS